MRVETLPGVTIMNFIEHSSLKHLLPHVRECIQKRLVVMKLGGKKYTASEVEIYTSNVFEKVGELDSCIKSLRLAIAFIVDISVESPNVSDVYRYHYENFILRLTGIVDRAHLLVGASLCLKPADYEKLGGNQFVLKRVVADHPLIHKCLKSIAHVASDYKLTRNKIAHSSEFSSRELGIFSAIDFLNIEVGEEVDLHDLMNNYFSEGGSELEVLVDEVTKNIHELLTALHSIYVQVTDFLSGRTNLTCHNH